MAVTALEQLVLELINRARLDPVGEAARVGISLNEGLAAGTLVTSARQPLAMNDQLAVAARGHSQHMIKVDKFGHVGIGDATPTDRMKSAGYVFTGAWTNGENIAFRGTTATVNQLEYAVGLHNDLFIDKGYAGRGHRVSILKNDFKEVGVGLAGGLYLSGGVNYNASMLTTDFAKTGTKIFITGVAFNDGDRDNFYDVGEARASVAVTVETVAGSLLGRGVTGAAGGYSAAINPQSAAVEVTFSGGGLTRGVSAVVSGAAQNVKVDLVNTNKIQSSASTTLGDGATSLTLLGVSALAGTGNAAANAITGNKGGNVLKGEAGSDTLDGGLGNDDLSGGLGRDILKGGSGHDIFRFNSVAEMGNNSTTRDVISDMLKTAATGIDRIHLAAIDANSVGGTSNDVFAFRATAAFTAAGQIRYEKLDLAGTANDKTIVYGNTDANLTTNEFQIELKGLVTLAATDFVL